MRGSEPLKATGCPKCAAATDDKSAAQWLASAMSQSLLVVAGEASADMHGAEVVRAYKPSPQVYTETADILGLAPAELCLVAAHNGDLAAARRLGLSTAFVVRPTEHGPDQKTDLKAEQAWDFVVNDLNELASQLDASID